MRRRLGIMNRIAGNPATAVIPSPRYTQPGFPTLLPSNGNRNSPIFSCGRGMRERRMMQVATLHMTMHQFHRRLARNISVVLHS